MWLCAVVITSWSITDMFLISWSLLSTVYLSFLWVVRGKKSPTLWTINSSWYSEDFQWNHQELWRKYSDNYEINMTRSVQATETAFITLIIQCFWFLNIKALLFARLVWILVHYWGSVEYISVFTKAQHPVPSRIIKKYTVADSDAGQL